MRRRIDCNYIVFLRHVFDKSKAKEISSRKKNNFSVEIKQNGIYENKMQSRLQMDATVAIVAVVVFQMDCQCLMT